MDLKYLEDLALLQTKKRATDMSGVMAPTAHTDPQAAINQELKDKAAAHNVDVFNLGQQQAIKAANHAEDVKWKLEETALASTLKATILDPTAETAKTTLNAWKDNYALFTQIPREQKQLWDGAQTSIDKINEDLTTAFGVVDTDSTNAIARMTLLHTTTLPAIQTAADPALDIMLDKSAKIDSHFASALQNIILMNQFNGANGSSPYVQGSGSGGGGQNPPPPPPPEDPGNNGTAAAMAQLSDSVLAASDIIAKAFEIPKEFIDTIPYILRQQYSSAGVFSPLADFSGAQSGANSVDWSKVQKLELKPPPASDPVPVYVVDPLKMLGNSGMQTGGSNGYQGNYLQPIKTQAQSTAWADSPSMGGVGTASAANGGSTARGASGNGTTIVVQVNAPTYGVRDFENSVTTALTNARTRGYR